MNTEFQTSIQTLTRLHEANQETISRLEGELQELKEQFEALRSIFSLFELASIRERAESEGVSVDVWLKDIIVCSLNKDVRAVYLDRRVYDKLCRLAEARNIDIDTLLTRSGVTEFFLNAIQSGRL